MDAKSEKRQRLMGHKDLNSWFLAHFSDKPDKLRQNKTWQTMRKHLTKMGYWKNLPRGKPDARYLPSQGNEGKQEVLQDNKPSFSTGTDTTYEVFNE